MSSIMNIPTPKEVIVHNYLKPAGSLITRASLLNCKLLFSLVTFILISGAGLSFSGIYALPVAASHDNQRAVEQAFERVSQQQPEQLAETIGEALSTAVSANDNQHIAARHIFETFVGAALIFITSDQQTAVSIALMATIQLFYYTLWAQPWYQTHRDAFCARLARWSQDSTLCQRIKSSPWFLKFKTSYPVTFFNRFSWFFLNKGTLFSLSSYLITKALPLLVIENIGQSWPAFFKRLLAPEWLSQRLLPFSQQWAQRVITQSSPYINSIKNRLSQHQISFGSLVHNVRSWCSL